MKKQVISGALGVVAVASLSLPSAGQLLVSDSYLVGDDPTAGEYDVVTDARLKEQPANLTNLGFANGPFNGGTGTSQNGVEDVNLGGTLPDSVGGRVKYTAAGGAGLRSNARNLSGITSASTYYITHTLNRGDNPTTGDSSAYNLTGFGNFIAPDAGTTGGNLAGLFVGFTETADTGVFGNLVIRHRDGAGTVTTDEILATSTFSTTFTVVMKAEINVGGGSTDEITWWVNPTSFEDDLALTASADATGSFNSFAFGSSSDLQRLNYVSRNWDGNVFFDEARIALTSASLVPEPTSLALLGVGGVALLARRRRA